MDQPNLRTERLNLRPRVMADLEASLAMDCEPGTTEWIDGPWDGTEAHRSFIRERINGLYPLGMGYWVITRKNQSDEFLGWVLMIPEDAIGPEIEIGWRLVTSARRLGYATEAAQAIVAHGFETLGLNCLIADMYRANTASMGVARKLGMRERRDPTRTTEAYVLWELTREMWAARNL
ncbi:MAG: GNAT family N-acetyltransferase [Pseudomonadota bacterium]